MARFVTSDEELLRLVRMRSKLIRDGVFLPNQVFDVAYKVFRMVDEARVLSRDVLGALLRLSRSDNLNEILLISIDPDPRECLSQVGEYGAVVIDATDDPDHIPWFCMGGTDSQGDPFGLVVDTFALFPISPRVPPWALYRDRVHYEAGIIGFVNTLVMDEFLELDEAHVTVLPTEAAATFLSLPYWPGRLPDVVQKEFLHNYPGEAD